MSYQVLALKYRPQTFDEVVGQSHVTTTLSNAISTGRVAHAILFTGPRGTGKTTIARILAKAMNCETGPVATPCNTCKICSDIIKGHCTDVFEIDGASNNSVDQIRDLRENVTYMPSSAKYKIYIIDEVHMLSTAAFNALLKTLEEPPDHVMFIFATTEVHKIPATILSRCQRHDLGRIGLDSISNHLKTLGEQEGFHLDRQSLDLVAREADGSIRDSLSLFDRVLSAATDSHVSHEQVLDILGILDHQILYDLSDALVSKDSAKVIDIIESVNHSGQDLKKFYTDIILHFRNLNVIIRCGKDSPATNISASERERLYHIGTRLSAGYINDILQALLDEESLVRYSSHTRIAIETVLLTLLGINPGAQIDMVIKQIDTLASEIRKKFSQGPYPVHQEKTKPVEQEPPSPTPPPKAEKTVSPIKPPEGSVPYGATASDDRDKASPGKCRDFLKHIEQTLPSIFALLSKGEITEETDRVVVTLDNCTSFDKKRLDDKKKDLLAACKTVLNKNLEFKITSRNNQLEKGTKKKEEIKARQAAFNHPMVIEARKKFDGEIINY